RCSSIASNTRNKLRSIWRISMGWILTIRRIVWKDNPPALRLPPWILLDTRTETHMTGLTLEQANAIIAAALRRSAQKGYKPMAVVVLDAAGHLKAAQRQDGASMFRVDIATGKAWAAVGMDASSRTLAQRAKDNPNFF